MIVLIIGEIGTDIVMIITLNKDIRPDPMGSIRMSGSRSCLIDPDTRIRIKSDPV